MIRSPKDNLSVIRGVWEAGGESREVESELNTANHFPLKDTDPQQEDQTNGLVNGNQDIPMQKTSNPHVIPARRRLSRGAGIPEQLHSKFKGSKTQSPGK